MWGHGFNICHVKNIIDDVATDCFAIWIFWEFLWDIGQKNIWQRCQTMQNQNNFRKVKRKLKKSVLSNVHFVKIDNVGHVKSSMY